MSTDPVLNSPEGHAAPIDMPKSTMPKWLERLSKRRGSCNFSDDHVLGDQTPSPPDREDGVVQLNKYKYFGLIPTHSSRGKSVKVEDHPFDFKPQSVDEGEDGFQKFLENTGRTRRHSLTIKNCDVILEAAAKPAPQTKDDLSLVKLVKNEDFSLIHANNVDKKKELDVLEDLNVYDDENVPEKDKDDNVSRKSSRNESQELHKEVKPGKITTAILNSKFAQNWFFKDESAKLDVEGKKSYLSNSVGKSPVTKRREMREMNFFSPQNL